jgi:hypothetical protein
LFVVFESRSAARRIPHPPISIEIMGEFGGFEIPPIVLSTPPWRRRGFWINPHHVAADDVIASAFANANALMSAAITNALRFKSPTIILATMGAVVLAPWETPTQRPVPGCRLGVKSHRITYMQLHPWHTAAVSKVGLGAAWKGLPMTPRRALV